MIYIYMYVYIYIYCIYIYTVYIYIHIHHHISTSLESMRTNTYNVFHQRKPALCATGIPQWTAPGDVSHLTWRSPTGMTLSENSSQNDWQAKVETI